MQRDHTTWLALMGRGDNVTQALWDTLWVRGKRGLQRRGLRCDDGAGGVQGVVEGRD